MAITLGGYPLLELLFNIAFRASTEPRPKTTVEQQPIKGRALNEALVAVIAVVPAKPDKSDRASNRHRQVLGIAVGLLQFVRELKIGSAARKTDALAGWRRPAEPDPLLHAAIAFLESGLPKN